MGHAASLALEDGEPAPQPRCPNCGPGCI